MTPVDTATLVGYLNRWHDLRRLTPRTLTLWHILFVATPSWVAVGDLALEFCGLDQSCEGSVYQAICSLRRGLMGTQWTVQTRRASRLRGDSIAYCPTAYRLVQQAADNNIPGEEGA